MTSQALFQALVCPPQVSTPTSQAARSLTPPCTEARLFLYRQGNRSNCCPRRSTLPLES